MIHPNRLLVIAVICIAVFICQSHTSIALHDDEKPTNLKILPKDISGDDLHQVMREYSKSLGVKCGFCHERKKEGEHPDFASDAKQEKIVSREMMLMVNAINEKYLATMGDGHFEKITCVTCHNGHTKPMVSVDSLPKNPAAAKAPPLLKDTLKKTIVPVKER